MAATNTVLTGSQFGAYAITLSAATVDSVTFPTVKGLIEVWADGTSAVYFTVDGSTPTIGGASTFEIPAGAPAVREVGGNVPGLSTPGSVVKLQSAGTPKYSVRGQ